MPSRPRQHSHLPRHCVYPRHVLAELNSSGLRSRLSRLASKPLARTKVNVTRDKPYCQPDCAPVRCAFLGPSYVSPRVQLRTHVLRDIPDAFPLRSIASAMLIMPCFWSAGLGDEIVIRVTTSLPPFFKLRESPRRQNHCHHLLLTRRVFRNMFGEFVTR